MLSDGVVTLRALVDRDADAITRACQDPDIIRWTTIPTPYEREHAIDWIRSHGEDWWANPTWAITEGSDDWGGSIDLRLDGAGGAEVGYLVAPWLRGHQVATRALRLACTWAFNALGIEVVRWYANVGNEASRAVAEHVGFRIHRESLRLGLVQRGVRIDGWVADLLREDLIATSTRRNRSRLPELTRRERQVLGLMAEGRSNRQIASTLAISEYTVKNHVRAVLDKLHASSRVEAVMIGIKTGITPPP